MLSVLVAANPGPIIATANEAETETVISNMGLYIPVSIPGAYAVDWQAGDKSVWRSNEARLFYTAGYAKGGFVNGHSPLLQLSNNAGGRW